MGAYKFYNPTTNQWEIIKSKSIIKDDGSLEYTPDDIKIIDSKVTTISGASGVKEKANKIDLDEHLTTNMAHGGTIWKKIEELILDVETSSIIFDVPAEYTEFKLIGKKVSVNSTGVLELKFNETGYDNSYFTTTVLNTTVTSVNTSSRFIIANSLTFNPREGMFIVNIYNPHDSKTIIDFNSKGGDGSSFGGFGSGFLREVFKISKIIVSLGSGALFKVGTHFEVWGR
ncbi:hypothetical protein ACR77J_08205 [Tissierella praeacuta]|uniref:hypothetical protein n=1 Tax=Tissierella praeacuta TaxID=43131 RepID=UPI003DA598BC